jgi:type II secretory pathway pseudopilin PulG
MRTFIKRSGFSFFDVSFVVIVTAIIGAIAVPTLLSSRRTANETAAVGTLRTIQTAQVNYRLKMGGGTAFANFDQLRAAGFLDGAFTGESVVKNNYTIAQSVSENGVAYCAKASPSAASGGTKYFGINQKGVVYQSAAADEIICLAGILTISGGAAPQN